MKQFGFWKQWKNQANTEYETFMQTPWRIGQHWGLALQKKFGGLLFVQ